MGKREGVLATSAMALAVILSQGCAGSETGRSAAELQPTLQAGYFNGSDTGGSGYTPMKNGVMVSIDEARLELEAVELDSHHAHQSDAGVNETHYLSSDDASIDLLSNSEVRLHCSPNCGIDESDLDSIELKVVRLRLGGTIRFSSGAEQRFRLVIRLDGHSLKVALREQVLSGGGSVLALKLKLALDSRMLAEVDWTKLANTGDLDLDAPGSEAAKAWLLSIFDATQLEVKFERNP